MTMSIRAVLSVHSIGSVCALLATLLYLNTWDADLVFDDMVAIQTNNDLRPHSPWSNLLWHDFWGYKITDNSSHKSYRPLCSASFKINYHLHELDPRGYHIGNVIFNAIVCYLFVVVCGRVFEYKLWPVLISGLLYTVHPIHTEVVAGVVGRAELMSAAFFLLALLIYQRVENSIGLKWLMATLILCLCSFLSKEQGIMAASVCLTYEVFILQKMNLKSLWELLSLKRKLQDKHKRLLLRAVILGLFSLSLLSARVLLMRGGPKFSKSDQPGQKLSTPFRQLYYLHLVFVNAWLLFFPSQLRHDYRFGYIPLVESFADYRHLLTVVFFISLVTFGLYVTIKQRTQSHTSSFALALMTLFFLPSSNLFINVGFVVAERVLYIPSMGLCLLVGLGASCLLRSNHHILRHFAKVGVGVLILSHSAKTVNRNEVWNTGYELYVEALKLYPGDSLMFSNLAFELERRNNTALSEQAQLLAIELGPRHVQPYRNYGAQLQKQERYKEAEKMYRKAIEMSGPTLRKYQSTAEVYKALAEVISTNKSRYQDSLIVMELLTKIAPDLPMAHKERARYLIKLNRSEEARLVLQRFVLLHPNKEIALLELGNLYLEEDETEKARESFREGLKVQPTNGHLMLELGCIMASNNTANLGDLKLALKYLKSVVSADPSIAKAHFHLGMIYVKMQKIHQAKDYLEKTLELDPSHKDAAALLGYVYYTLERFSEVVAVLSAIPEEDRFQNTYYDMVTLLGNSYLKMEEHDKAQKLYYDVLRKDLENLSALNGLGALRAKQRKIGEALNYFKKVLQLDRENERALTFLRQLNAHP